MRIETANFIIHILVVVVCVRAGGFETMLKRLPRDTFVKKLRSNPEEQHELVFAIQQRHLKDLEEVVRERSNPNGHKYQQWLTSEQVANLTSNAAGTKTVENWLQELGANVTWKSVHGDYIRATAPLFVWEDALATEFHQFELTTESMGDSKVKMLHRADHYSLPSHVREHLSAVFNTIQTPSQLSAKHFMLDGFAEQSVGSNLRKRAAAVGSVTVEFLNTYYEIANHTGNANHQQAVFQTADEYFCPNDLRQFQRNHNIPDQEAVAPYGYSTTNCLTNSCSKGNLDMQYLMGIAQNTSTIYWYTAQSDTSDPLVDWITAVANTPAPPQVNIITWSTSERDLTADVLDAFNTEALKLAAMGVTLLVSSGDNGAAGASTLCATESSVSVTLLGTMYA